MYRANSIRNNLISPLPKDYIDHELKRALCKDIIENAKEDTEYNFKYNITTNVIDKYTSETELLYYLIKPQSKHAICTNIAHPLLNNYFQCSNCKKLVREGVFEELIKNINYCPFCGCKIVKIEKEGELYENFRT